MLKKKITVLTLFFFLEIPFFAQKTSQPVTLSIWYEPAVSEAGAIPKDSPVIQIIRDKLGIDVTMTMLPANESDCDVKLNTAAASGALPDIFMVNRTPWLNMVKSGLLATVDDMYPMMKNRTKKFYHDEQIRYTSVGGKSYGMASSVIIPHSYGLLIRKDWLDYLGLKVPVTTDDFMYVMKQFTYHDPDGDGKQDTWGFGGYIETNSLQEGLGLRFDAIMGAFGVAGTWSVSKRNPGMNIMNSKYFDALCYVKQMVEEKVIDPNWMTYRSEDFHAAWKQGRFGIMCESFNDFASESNYNTFDKNFPTGEWIVINPPVGPMGYSSTGCGLSPYKITAVSKKAEKEGKKETIARLLEWMCSEDGYYLLGWGNENVNYIFDTKGMPTALGVPDSLKAYPKTDMQPNIQLSLFVITNSPEELQSRYPVYITNYSHRKMSAYITLGQMQLLAYTDSTGADAMPIPSDDLKRFLNQGILEFVTGRRQLTHEDWYKWLSEFNNRGGTEWNKECLDYALQNSLLK